MKKQLILACALLMSVTAYSQEFTLEYQPGYGAYNMSSMKNHLKQSLQNSPLKGVRTTDNFSGYLTHSLRMGYLINKHHFGIVFSHMNTAGQNHLADYSGEYLYRMRVYGNKLGVFYQIALSEPGILTPFFELSTGGVFNKARIKASLSVEGTGASNDEAKLKGTNLFIQPALGIVYRFSSFASLSASVGYEWDPLTGMSIEGNKANINADWSGLRINAGITTYFKTK